MSDEEIKKLKEELHEWQLAATLFFAYITAEDDEQTVEDIYRRYEKVCKLSWPDNPPIPPGGPYPGFGKQ